MGVTRRSVTEMQFRGLLQKTMVMDNNHWRKVHFYEHLLKLHTEVKDVPGISADDRVYYDKSMKELSGLMENLKENPSHLEDIMKKRREIVEEQQKLKSPHKTPIKSNVSISHVEVEEEEDEQSKDVAEVIRMHKEKQAKLAEQMLSMTSNLKQVSLAARDIIQQDNKKLSGIQDTVEKNSTKLTRETSKLEGYNKSSSKCWVWSLLFVVMVIFIVMVVFIRLFPRKR